MPYLLALDTSGKSCSVALLYQQPGQVDQLFALHEIAERSHTQRLLPMVSEVLDQAGVKQQQLDAIVYGRGPGSFTGIRIAAGVAQGLSFGLDVPLIAVSTLAAMAVQAHELYPNCISLCTLDARMNEVYAGVYSVDKSEPDLALVVQAEQVLAPANLSMPEGAYVLCGSGSEVPDFPAAIVDQAQFCLPEMEPQAAQMAMLGAALFGQGKVSLPEHGLPVYLRDEVTWQKLPRYQ